METTLTQLQRQTGRVADAIARRETVRLTRRGETIAEIQPRQRGLSWHEFGLRWKNRKRLGKELADEMAQTLKELDKAG
jgi:antitoxin (DNA-binding transcriptional repressor) of toxin-antitoxin stability system